MPNHPPIPLAIRWFLLLLAAVALTACAGSAWWQSAGALDLGPPIPIQPGGPHRGQTSAGAASLDYTYQADFQAGAPVRLRLAGELQDAYRRRPGVSLYVVYLDDGGRVLDRDLVHSAGPGGYGRKRDFDEALDLPAGTTAFRFGAYAGPERGHR